MTASIEGHSVELVLHPDAVRGAADRARERIGASASVARDHDVGLYDEAAQERVAQRAPDQMSASALVARLRQTGERLERPTERGLSDVTRNVAVPQAAHCRPCRHTGMIGGFYRMLGPTV